MDHSIKNGVLTLFLKGKVNSSNSEETEQDIDRIITNSEFKSIVFDMNELEYISSAGLRILVRVKQQIEDTKLVNVPDAIYEILEMVGFTSFFAVSRK